MVNYIYKSKNGKYNKKLSVCGNVVYKVEYMHDVFYGFKGESLRTMEMGKNIEKNRHDGVVKARRNIMMYAQNNFNAAYDKFITLTFKENITDLKIANNLFKKFIQRLRYKIRKDFKYLAVIEFQKRGAVHYHMLSNMDYIKKDELSKIWKNGFIKINRIKHVDDLGAYLIAYIGKNTKKKNKDKDFDLLKRNKSYLRSNNLKKPEWLIGADCEDKEKELNLSNKEICYNKIYPRPIGDDEVSLVTFTQYKIKSSYDKGYTIKGCNSIFSVLAENQRQNRV